ncbi:FAD binding domain protein [Hypoxylon sp. NC1633]|nr:FAD binding domain protein [Hypoxylon sp. NC1633]
MSPNAALHENNVDLLIIGAGPAGLMLALWASKFDMKTRIVDEKESSVSTGRADGLHSRTMEIFDSFGIAQDFLPHAYRVNEICSWNPSPHDDRLIHWTQKVVAQPHHLSRFPQLSLNQGMTERSLESKIKSEGKITIERNTIPVNLSVEETEAESDSREVYPIRVTLRKAGQNGTEFTANDERNDEDVKAKYVVGCDGAHSWVRQRTDLSLEGQRTDTQFGVMDIVPLSNFPGIRRSCVIHSKSGSVMTVPRENRLVRLYVQLGETSQGGNLINPKDVTPEMILTRAQRILKPYQIDFKICDWHSVYTVRPRTPCRLCADTCRIFLAGDAVHTHSPTLGQGMNVSIQDTFNLGWKLGSVVTGIAKPEILHTYNEERHHVATELIKLDKIMTDFYSSGPSRDSEEYQSFRDHFSQFLSGVAVSYGPSILTANTNEESLASGISLGQRLPSHKVVCNAEGNLVHMADMLPSNGAWRIVVFAGDVGSPAQLDTVQQLGGKLETFLKLFPARIEVLLIHSGTRDLHILDLHPVYHPWDDTLGWDYWKVFSNDAEDFEPCRSPYQNYGVDENHGCVVVLRPDQHVSYIGSLDRFDNLRQFFSGALVS